VSFELVGLLAVTIVLLVILVTRPSVTRGRGGRILAFVGICGLTTLALAVGLGAHVERAKRTEFCLKCHIMEPYGKSLRIDDAEYVPASHVQNNRVNRDEACFTCHTTYALYGDLRAKIGGLRHIVVNYLGSPPDTIRLYEPYNNRECLHCHNGARSFEQNDAHLETDTTMVAMKANRMSCMTSGCHDLVHDVRNLETLPMWKGTRG
jgi:nitrate/TMAO reductase-like tetraheme cytochrome c subunit